jgi:hypothetical protein
MRKFETVAGVLLTLSLAAAGAQEAERALVTATLLPAGENQAGTFELRADPRKEQTLEFDLGSVARGATLDTARLRLVSSNPAYNPDRDAGGVRVTINGRLATIKGGGPNILTLSPLLASSTGTTVNAVAISKAYGGGEFLGKEVAEVLTGDQRLAITLSTNSTQARSLIYSSRAEFERASDKPRLTLRYATPPQPLLDSMSWAQYQHDPEHTGRSGWRPFLSPAGFDLKVVQIQGDSKGNAAKIAFHPLVWRGDVVLINKPLDRNYLVTLDFSGRVRRPFEEQGPGKDIGPGTLQVPPVIGPTGILYVVTEDAVKSFDLNSGGAPLSTFALTAKPLAGSQATVGRDGSLFLLVKETGDQSGHVYGFTAGLVPFLREGPLALGDSSISAVSMRPDGGSLFIQTPKGALEIDMSNPSSQTETPLVSRAAAGSDRYWAPVAGQGVTVFVEYNDNQRQGNLWWYRHSSEAPPSVQRYPGTGMTATKTTQPVLAADGRVYFIENGILHAADPRKDPAGWKRSADQNLASTSNPVLDGAGRFHFWNNGRLSVYGADLGSPLATVDMTDPGQDWPARDAPLVLGADGTLYTNNQNESKLFVFSPSFDADDGDKGLCLKQADVKTRTAYRTKGELRGAHPCAGTGAKLVVKAGQQILLQGRKGIGLGAGFSVQRGAGLLARTGF